MPQMAPISWLLMMIIFSVSFIIFNMMNYYSFHPTMPKSSGPQKIKTSSFMWKW
uniref:ATP synthase complex subunit 8 n=2 Tax=Gasterophilus TaxID=84524 RepID=A0A4P7YDV8_9MUSC|nr:ATP synthase F0 subunit 8 [Gasterophilus haemorrhoidalis]YP_009653372.1 ATP synthase F0 subunit 8 [Gasterophilus inermis]QCG71491.1 ATP synthase F0 subunit 8 [Gasterophilus haemorrhoidalis]QCG71505.1 ATP synthase F0 subunit 8 [Gasterophilus inermis]